MAVKANFAASRLHEPAVLREQVQRLLSDPKAKAFNTNFTGQWLSLRAIDATMPDGTLYPEYDDILKTSMLKETSLGSEDRDKLDEYLSSVRELEQRMVKIDRFPITVLHCPHLGKAVAGGL